MKLNAVLVGVLFTMFSIPVYGNEVERWLCYQTGIFHVEDPAIFEVVRTSDTRGAVIMDGVTFRTDFYFEGLDRRWVFDSDRDYQVIMAPDKTGGYFDFTHVEQDERIQPDIGCRFERK